ncbi:ABC transporter permease [Chitinophaga filiformis]|uniref:ABC transporter permease n=1 Tax=Chitinophaga filiformis TaxID=104663 RepID=UPI001F178793|nr:ABC transporter permease [Chitinophaga filiformis]MCF6402095.1 ABC transporter permease [Chitinophaga filiformis]
MLNNYLRIGWRNLRRYKMYSSINIGGLAIGLAVGILILVWVQDELSYDRFHENGKNLYKLTVSFSSGSDVQTWEGMPGPIAIHAVKDIPGVQKAVRTRDNWGDVSKFTYNNNDFFDIRMGFVEPSFFTLFTFPLLKGDAQHPFPDNMSLVVTRSAALKYFGTTDVMGKVIAGDGKNYVVTGLMEDFPEQSSIRYEFMLPFSILQAKFVKSESWPSLDADWGDFYFTTYLQLAPNTSTAKVAAALATLRPDSNQEPGIKYNVQPLFDVHLYNPDLSEGAIKIVRIFLIIAVVILLIACVNYVNLSTARAMQRAAEVGVRKIVGASRRQLFIQFVWESVLVFMLALVLAIAIILLLIPFYNNLTGKHLSFSLQNLQMVLAIGLAMLVTLIVAGIYPAVILSSFNPLKTLKGGLTLSGSNVSFRRVLVVVQFLIATVLIVSTLVVGQQLRYIKSKALGYDKENVFSFSSNQMYDHLEAAVQELSAAPGVAAAATANHNMTGIDNSTGDTYWDGKEKNETLIAHVFSADKNFMEMMKFGFAEGQNFTNSKADSAHFIINETAAKMMRMKDPVGKKFRLWDIDGTIIGVIKDFHYASLHEKIGPLVVHYRPVSYKVYVKTKPGEMDKAVASAERLYKRYNAGFPFRYTFIDDNLNKLYKLDRRTGILFNYFAGIAIFISCLGLFGLATFATGQRVKEIGVRKVLGASVSNIVTLLTSDFLKIVIISIALSVPVAWYIMNRWLEDYAYRININWGVFIMAGGLAVAIALLTVSFQAIKAALANPVRSLRTE